MSRIDELIAEYCPGGVEFKTLGELFGSIPRGRRLTKSNLAADGSTPVFHGGLDPIGFHDRANTPGRTVMIINTGASSGTVGWSEVDFWCSDGCFALPHSEAVEARFLYYYALANHRLFVDRVRRAGIPTLAADAVLAMRTPIPPPQVQREIVRVLDQFTALEAELEAELEARTRQYAHYRTSLFDDAGSAGIAWSTLGAISTSVSSGATPRAGAAEYYTGGTIPWLRTSEVTFGEIWDTEMRITDRALKETGASWIKENCVIVAISGATAARSAINKIPLTTNQHCCNLEIDPEQANYRYVFFWVGSRYEELKAFGRGARSDLNAKLIKDFPIPIPTLEEQHRIVSLLDKFDALVNDLSIGLPAELAARRKQFEFYRDKLLTFEEASA